MQLKSGGAVMTVIRPFLTEIRDHLHSTEDAA
jgi:hypothetical protein